MAYSTRDAGLRVRAIVDEYVVVLVIALVALVAVGGFMTYGAYGQTTERTETETDTVVTWTSTGQFTHQATVINDTRVYDAGETLVNRSAYFQKITPRLNGSFVYEYTAESGELTAETTTRLVVRSVSESESGAQREYWRTERQLDRDNRTLAPDETLRRSFTQNVTRLAVEIRQIRRQLGTSAGTVEATVVTTLRLDGTRNGESVATNRSYRLPLTIEDALYRVNDTGPVVEQGERTVREQETVVVPPGPFWRFGGPLALIVGLLGLPGVAYARYAGHVPITEREHAYLDYRADRAEFDEWITEARVPRDRVVDTETHVETATLAGLVDLAIDTDGRVIETPDSDRYLVLHGDVVYSFEPATPDESGEFDQADEATTPESDSAAALTGESVTDERGRSDATAVDVDGDGLASEQSAGGDDEPADADDHAGDDTGSGSAPPGPQGNREDTDSSTTADRSPETDPADGSRDRDTQNGSQDEDERSDRDTEGRPADGGSLVKRLQRQAGLADDAASESDGSETGDTGGD